MRLFFGILLLVMFLFMAVQYNDPDGPLWVLIYSVPALLMLVAMLRPGWFSRRAGRWIRAVMVLGLAAGVIWFWPSSEGFWRQEVWWETETAREGMGMMIAFLVGAAAFLVRAKEPTSVAGDSKSVPQ